MCCMLHDHSTASYGYISYDTDMMLMIILMIMMIIRLLIIILIVKC